MENHTSLEKRAQAKELIKKALREEFSARGISISDLPRMLEKQALFGAAGIAKGLGALASIPAAAITAAPKTLEFFGQWAPLATTGIGALGGTAAAFAISTHLAQQEEHKRKVRKVDKLLLAAAQARKGRQAAQDRRRQEILKQRELSQSGGFSSDY